MWLVAINSGAAGIGKMLSPQSIAIAIGAVLPALEEFNKRNNVPEAQAKEGQEAINPSSIMKKVFVYFILFLVMDGVIAFFGHNFAHLIDGFLK